MTKLNTCGTCTHLESDGQGGHICIRNPPTAQIVMATQRTALGQSIPQPQVMAAWPPVKEHQRCGEYRPGSLIALQ